MPLTFPTFKELTDRVRADVATSLPGTDPTLENSLLDAIVTANASRISDVYTDMTRLLAETFPQTASAEFLDQHGEVFGITRLPSTKATGIVVFNGTPSTSVLIGTEFSSSDGFLYTSTASVSVNTVNLSVASLTRSGQTATATFSSAHGLVSGIQATIAGAVQTQYNGTFTITVTSATTVQYEITGSPASPATGTIILSANVAKVPIESQETGADKNKDSGASFTTTSTIIGLNQIGYADFNEVIGGSDTESDDNYRTRIIAERSSLEALFDEAQIKQFVFSVPGVTRVKVKKIYPAVGQVTILFVRDNDPGSIIPSAGEIQDVKDAIVIPAHTDPADVFVLAPTPVTVNFDFTALSPDTPELRAAIQSNLEAFFREEVTFEQSITEDKYRSIIATTIDPVSGTTVQSFTLSTPTGTIAIGTSQLAVLGTVTFSV